MRRPCDRFGRVCPLSVRLEPALPRLHHVSALCPAWCLLWVLFRRNLAARPLPAFVRHVLVRAGPPCVQCPLKPWPCLWILSALDEVCFSHHRVADTFILHARWSVFLAFILATQSRPLPAHPMLEKLFGVYAGSIFFQGISFGWLAVWNSALLTRSSRLRPHWIHLLHVAFNSYASLVNSTQVGKLVCPC